MVAHPDDALFFLANVSAECWSRKISADLAVDVSGDPEPFNVAADIKCRDLGVDDAGIEPPKLCGDVGRLTVPALFRIVLFQMHGIEGDRGHHGLLEI